ncbi:MAG: hypothetical protein MI864_00250 [Pseudomonadales bacterium]|nr:hypothetical protein [Pseudomonadales bacterium]
MDIKISTIFLSVGVLSLLPAPFLIDSQMLFCLGLGVWLLTLGYISKIQESVLRRIEEIEFIRELSADEWEEVS